MEPGKTNKYTNSPVSNKIKTNKKALFNSKIRIYNAKTQFLISPLFYFWDNSPNNKVSDNQGNLCGHYNIYTDTNKNKYLIVSSESVLSYITPEILDFETATDLSSIDKELYDKWKNVVE